MIDIISSIYGENVIPEIKVLDKGMVRLVDVMPRLVPQSHTCDQSIVQAARVSYGIGTKTVNEDRGLIRYLMRHRHTTPFEMVELKFHIKLPVFSAREMIRHRTSNVNEVSGRYSVLPDEFHIPEIENIRKQSKTNKQCSEGQIEVNDAEWFANKLEDMSDNAYKAYEEAIEKGIGKEQARMFLPVNIMTEWYWKCDLHNVLHFLALRCDSHAQFEIRVFAEAMLKLIAPLAPWTIEAWNDYHPMRGGMLLSQLEVESIKNGGYDAFDGKMLFVPDELNTENKREKEEWEEKKKRLGLDL